MDSLPHLFVSFRATVIVAVLIFQIEKYCLNEREDLNTKKNLDRQIIFSAEERIITI